MTGWTWIVWHTDLKRGSCYSCHCIIIIILTFGNISKVVFRSVRELAFLQNRRDMKTILLLFRKKMQTTYPEESCLLTDLFDIISTVDDFAKKFSF